MAGFCHVLVNGSDYIDDAGLIYEIPDYLSQYVLPGTLVYVPYGNSRLRTGFVLDLFSSDEAVSLYKIKQVFMMQCLTPLLDKDMLNFAFFISTYYSCSLFPVIRQMIPSYIMNHCFISLKNNADGSVLPYKPNNADLQCMVENGEYSLVASSAERVNRNNSLCFYAIDDLESLQALDHAPKQKEIFEHIVHSPGATFNEINFKFPKATSFLTQLERKGLVFSRDENISLQPKTSDLTFVQFTDTQQSIYDRLVAAYLTQRYSKHLINGVTGSGKTLIYERLAEHVIQSGRQVLILEPEIMLSSQIFERLSLKFSNSLALIHSQMTDRERYEVWKSVKEGCIKIVVGPRSSLFLPFSELGLIVVDEEHDGSYKQDEPDPRYHAVRCAEYLAKAGDALLLLGSATPSLETLYDIVRHHCSIHNLTERANNSSVPDVTIVDMREERRKGNYSLFSNDLANAMRVSLNHNEQVILFLNRKGYSSSVTCLDCGETIKCPRCDIPLTFYQSSGRLQCGYCGYTIAKTDVCPNCHSHDLSYSGVGTESIEEACALLFPDAVSARLDAQAIKNESNRERILIGFKKNEINILIGTQIIAKGLDFRNVSCVGVINADVTLNMPDYYSAERGFQLMVQVVGRAGRHGRPSRAFIQSYQPEHYALQHAADYDIHGFFLREMEIRKQGQYPPLVYLCRVVVSDKIQEKAEQSMKLVMEELLKGQNMADIALIGPAYALLAKKNNRYRLHFILKCVDREPLLQMMQCLRVNLRSLNFPRSSRITIDMDPRNIF